MLTGSGHIAGVVNPPSKKKYQHWTGGAVKGQFQDWLANAKEAPGSWRNHWIRSHDNTLVKARKPGARRVKIIEEAPGAYVKMQG